MVRTWPSDLTILDTSIEVIRPGGKNTTPNTSLDRVYVSPYLKYRAIVTYKPSREGGTRKLSRAWAALQQGQAEGIQIPLNVPMRAKTTAVINATGSGSTLTLVAPSGGTAKSKINGGAGFAAGNMFSLVHNGENYVYTVRDDQINDTITLTSRLRGGLITAATPIEINNPVFVGFPDQTIEAPMDGYKLISYSLTLVERR